MRARSSVSWPRSVDETSIPRLREELFQLASSVRRLQQAGLDSACAELLLRRRRADLEDAAQRYARSTARGCDLIVATAAAAEIVGERTDGIGDQNSSCADGHLPVI